MKKNKIHCRAQWGGALAVAALAIAPVLGGATASHATASHAASGAAAANGAIMASGPMGAEQGQAETVYSVPFSDRLYEVVSGQTVYVTWERWVEMGYPKPVATTAEFARYSWSKTVMAVLTVPGESRSEFGVDVSAAELKRAGNPEVKVAPWIPGTRIIKYDSSAEIFAWLDERQSPGTPMHKLTFAEWAAMGYPPHSSGDSITKFPWLDAVFYHEAGGKIRSLSFEEWQFRGYPTPRLSQASIYAWSFAANGIDIVFTFPAAGYSKVVTPAEWAKAGYPMPPRG